MEDCRYRRRPGQDPQHRRARDVRLEYAAKFGEGISFSTNTFYRFYISLTFFHFMHVILGMAILAILWVKTRQGAYGSHDAHGLESGAAYWHMVDLLWIVLFPLVYVMR
jgi:nitric oxide reductase NorE protein